MRKLNLTVRRVPLSEILASELPYPLLGQQKPKSEFKTMDKLCYLSYKFTCSRKIQLNSLRSYNSTFGTEAYRAVVGNEEVSRPLSPIFGGSVTSDRVEERAKPEAPVYVTVSSPRKDSDFSDVLGRMGETAVGTAVVTVRQRGCSQVACRVITQHSQQWHVLCRNHGGEEGEGSGTRRDEFTDDEWATLIAPYYGDEPSGKFAALFNAPVPKTKVRNAQACGCHEYEHHLTGRYHKRRGKKCSERHI